MAQGQEIAVKRLSKTSNQGIAEFMNEVGLVAKLQHRNLVSVLGGCTHGNERMLVYEYMPNGSLNHFIFGKTINAKLATWKSSANMSSVMLFCAFALDNLQSTL